MMYKEGGVLRRTHYLDIWGTEDGRCFAYCSKGMWCRIIDGPAHLIHPDHTHIHALFADPEGTMYDVTASVEDFARETE